MSVIPEPRSVGGKLEKDLDVAGHPEHVDYFVPGSWQWRLKNQITVLEDTNAMGKEVNNGWQQLDK